MNNKVRSALGQEVDFDMMKIKQQLSDTPQSTDVKAREEYVRNRQNRRAAKRAAQLAAQQETASAIVDVKDDQPIDVDSEDSEKKESTNKPSRKQQRK